MSRQTLVIFTTLFMTLLLLARCGGGGSGSEGEAEQGTQEGATLEETGVAPRPAAAADCTTSLQTKINAAPSGGTVMADPCIYREQIVINKPLTLQGQPGTEIRGSDVWTEFSPLGAVYVSSKTLPTFAAHGECKPGTSECLWPEQVFLDGEPLAQLANGSMPGSGQFSLDSSRRVVLGDNPQGRTVEVARRTAWIRGGAAGVTLDGLTMKHAANDSQGNAALRNDGYSAWTLKNSDLSYSHGALLSFSGASGLNILNNTLHHGGELAIHSNGGSVTFSGNTIRDNNISGFSHDWEAGGVKQSRMSSIVAENNRVYNNDGVALWCDINCSNATYRGNTVHHNAHIGIFFEISDGAKIYDNVVYENGWLSSHTAGGGWRAAIRIANSRNAEVYNNTVAWNVSQISVTRQDRGNATWNDVYNNYIHDNPVFSKDYSSSFSYNHPYRTHALAWIDFMGNGLYHPSKKNQGYSNDYYYSTPENSSIPRYMWDNNGISSLKTFNATTREEQGRYLSEREKSAILSSKGVPATPEH